MSNRLRSCIQCQRHIRISETVCPFCQAPVPAARMTPPPRGTPARRLGRAAAVATLATVGSVGTVDTAACGGDVGGNGNDGGSIFTVADAYGVADVFAPDTSMSGTPLYGGVEQPDSAEPDVVTSADAAYGVAEIPDAEPDAVAKQDAANDGGTD